MTPKELASLERMVGFACATVISIAALITDGEMGMMIAGGSAAAAAGAGAFFGARTGKES